MENNHHSKTYERIGTDKRIGTAVPIPFSGIGTRISEAAKALGSRKIAADVMGCSEAALQRYVSEKNMPPFDVVARLCLASGRSMDWLATGITPESKQLGHSHEVSEEALIIALEITDDIINDLKARYVPHVLYGRLLRLIYQGITQGLPIAEVFDIGSRVGRGALLNKATQDDGGEQGMDGASNGGSG